MRRIPYILVSILLLWCRSGVATINADFSRYSVILERKPFGAAPVIENSPAPPKPEMDPAAQQLARNYRVCAISDSPDFGIRVGIVDIKAKPLKSYFLHIGDSEDGLELLDADYEKEGAFVKKDGKSFWLYLNGSGGSMAGGGASAGSLKTASSVRLRLANSRKSINEKRRLKRQQILDARRKRSNELAEMNSLLTAEERKVRQESYQMELIRAGGAKGPPLPLRLTKEMDDQLVAEGVLPPQEEEE